MAGEDHFDGTLGRGPEQILRALGLHHGFPFDQTLGEDRRFDLAFAINQQLADQDGLFGVVGDRAFGHVRGDRLIGAGIFEVSDVAKARLNFSAA
ncbi:hypothetical protein D3C84_723560 [compost metagenome]